jgi:hypothetical protein
MFGIFAIVRGGGDKGVCPVNGAEDVNSKAVPIEAYSTQPRSY